MGDDFIRRHAFGEIVEDHGDHDAANVVEWGALGFLFAMGVLSFADARPRGFSDAEFDANDEFQLGDFVAALEFHNGELHLDTDYVRGRRMKTGVIVRSQGTGMIETQGRGKAAHQLDGAPQGRKAAASRVIRSA